MRTIPAVIHIIWYGIDFPTPFDHSRYAICMRSIRNVSHCEIKLWSKCDCEELLKRYPEYAEAYAAATNIMRFDMMRYLIIYEHGGIYLDADVYLKQRLDKLKAAEYFFAEMYLSEEYVDITKTLPIRNGIAEDRERIANYAFASIPKNDIFLKALDEINHRIKNNIPKYQYDILYMTGPELFTTIIHRNPPRTIISERKSLIIMKHICVGSWRKYYEAENLPNARNKFKNE